MAQINNYSRSGNTTLITYNPRYPGFEEEDYKKLETAAINRGLTGQAKTQFMDEAYQHYYPQVLNSHKLDERQVEINKNVAETGNAILNGNKTAEWNMKLVDLAQTAKRVKGIAYDYPDDQLIDTMKSNIPNGDKLLLNYLNDGDKELLYQAGLLETDAQQKAKAYNQKRQKINNALLNNWRELSNDGLKYVRDYNVMFQVVDEARQQGMGEGMNDNELLLNLIYASPELQQIEKEMGTLNLSDGDRRILGESDKRYDKNLNQIENDFRNFIGWNSNTPATHEDLQEEIYVRENGGAKENAKNFRANLRNFGDSVEKFLYRAPKDFENWVYKNLPSKGILEAEMGKQITDEEYKNIVEDRLLNNKLSVKDYNESLDKEIQAYRDKIGLDPVIENYFNKHGIVESVVNGTGPRYKMAGETAGNWDMLLGMGASIINPGIGLMVMGTDTFARENQESFDSLINAQTKQGVSYEDAYDNASKGALVVGAVNTAIELGLEKFLGGVETTTAKNIKKMITKDLNKEVTDMVAKRGIIDLLRRGLTTQARASMEEGLEEIFQQLTQNIAVSQYDPDKKISEGLWEAFEGGALNPMNLLAGTTEIISAPTLSESDRQTFVNWANTLDVGGTQVADGFNPKTIVNNIKNGGLYSMAPTLSNIQQDNQGGIYNQAGVQANNQVDNQANNGSSFGEFIEEENFDGIENEQKAEEGVKKEGRFDKELDGLDDNVRERIRNNPYAIESSKEVINNLKNNPGFDYLDWQTEQYENILDSIVEKLDNADQKRSKDVGVLYDDLEKANKPIDVTNIQNNLEQYQRSIEDLGDVLSNTDKARLQNILKNIEEIGDGTMDVWKVRKIIDRFAKKGDGVTSYGLNLMKQIRKDIDNEIQQQNPDMKEVDKEYTKALDEIRELQGDLVYKKTGEVKNNAVSTVKNLLNPKNRLYLNTLEKYIPGIKQQLQGIRDSKFVFDAYTTGNGSRFVGGIKKGVGKGIGGIVGGGLGYAFGPLGVIGGAILGNIIQGKIDSALTKKAQQALERTVGQETEASKAELERINQKIAENQQLEAAEKAKLEELGKKILQNIETVDKTKEEQGVWDTIKEISIRDAGDLGALPLDVIRDKNVGGNPTDTVISENVNKTALNQAQNLYNEGDENLSPNSEQMETTDTSKSVEKDIIQAEKERYNNWEHNLRNGKEIWVDWTDESNTQTEAQHKKWVKNKIEEISGKKISKGEFDSLWAEWKDKGEETILNLIHNGNGNNYTPTTYKQDLENMEIGNKAKITTQDGEKIIVEKGDGYYKVEYIDGMVGEVNNIDTIMKIVGNIDSMEIIENGTPAFLNEKTAKQATEEIGMEMDEELNEELEDILRKDDLAESIGEIKKYYEDENKSDLEKILKDQEIEFRENLKQREKNNDEMAKYDAAVNNRHIKAIRSLLAFMK